MKKKYWILLIVLVIVILLILGVFFFFFKDTSFQNKKYLDAILNKEVRNFHTDMTFQLSGNTQLKQTLDANFNVVGRGGVDYLNGCGHYGIGFNEDKTEIQFFELTKDTVKVTSLNDMDVSKSDISKIYQLFLEMLKNEDASYRNHQFFVNATSNQQEQLSLYLNMLSCKSVTSFDSSPWNCVISILDDTIQKIQCNNSKYNTFSATFSGYNETELFKMEEE